MINATIISAIADTNWITVKYQLSDENQPRILRFDISKTPGEIEERIKIDVDAKNEELKELPNIIN